MFEIEYKIPKLVAPCLTPMDMQMKSDCLDDGHEGIFELRAGLTSIGSSLQQRMSAAYSSVRDR